MSTDEIWMSSLEAFDAGSVTEKERGQHILNMQERAGFRRWLAGMPMRILTR
jgi:hypothetical protein